MAGFKLALRHHNLPFVTLFLLAFFVSRSTTANSNSPDTGPKQPVEARAVPNRGRPGLLLYDLKSNNIAVVKYTVKCLAKTSKYQLKVMTHKHSVAVILDTSSHNVSCEHANHSSSSHGDSDALTRTDGSAAGNSDYDIVAGDNNTDIIYPFIGIVRGSFNVTIRGRNIGRSFFIITAEKLSGPDMPEGWAGSDSARDARRGNDTVGVQGLQKQLHKNQVGMAMIIVVQLPRTLDFIFQWVLITVIVLATMGMGLKVKVKVVWQVLKKPVGPAIGLVCQFLVMPLIAYGVAKSVPQDSAAIALGIFACGVVPGGGISNMFCYLLDGDVSLSVTMTTLSCFAALGMTPLWIFTLGATFKDDQTKLKVPYLKILEKMAYLIVPLFIGVLIQIKLPKLEKLISKVLKPVVFVMVAFVISLGIYTNMHIFQMIRPMVILAGCLLPYFGYLIGAIISLLCCQTWRRTKTIAIETGIQNTGVAFLMLYLSLPPPDNQLAAVGPAASAIMTPQPLFIIVIFYLIYKRCNRKDHDDTDNDINGLDEEAHMRMNKEAAKGLLKSKEPQKSDEDFPNKCIHFLTDGNGTPALVVFWEKICGKKKAKTSTELVNRQFSVSSPVSTTDDRVDLWAEVPSDRNGNVKA